MEKIVQNIKNEIGNNKVVACISTGPDSMVLLTLLEQALNKNQIIVAHVNHNVRRQSIEEEAFIKEYCENNNLVYKLLSLEPTNSNFEEYARTKRYEFFIDTAHLFDAKYILTGHNADDQVETVLRRMISKSSLKGFAGIEKISNFKGFKIYRPLLDVSKKDINKYANEQNITYFVDETNDSLQNQRSRIRNLITPLLLEENPNLYDAVKYYSDSLISASNEINHIRDSFIKKYIKFDNDAIKFNINDLLELTEYMQKEVLFEILKKYNLSVTCINETLKKINSNKSNIATKINDSLNMIKEYGYVIFTTESIEQLSIEIHITEPCKIEDFLGYEIIVEKNISYFIKANAKLWYNELGTSFVIRTRRENDYLDRKKVNKNTNETIVYKQSLSDYLTNSKVPYLERRKLLVIEKNNKIVYLVGRKF